MDDDVAEVHQDPTRVRFPLGMRDRVTFRSEFLPDLFLDRLDLPFRFARKEHEGIRVGAQSPHVEQQDIDGVQLTLGVERA